MTDNTDSNTIPLISDQLLEAYADGQLDSETERRVESLIANDKSLRDKALHIMALREGLWRAVEERAGVPVQPETYRLAQALSAKYSQNRRRRVPRYWLSCAAAFVLIGLFGAIWAATTPGSGPKRVASLQGFMTDAEQTAAREQVAAPASKTRDGEQPKAVQATVKTVPNGRDSEPVPEFVPTFSEWGFSLVETRLIEGKDQGAVHLLYESTDGRRVSLYYNSADNRGKQQVTVRQEGPLAILFWYAGDRAFSMIGEVDRNELLKLARTVTAGLSLDQNNTDDAPASAKVDKDDETSDAPEKATKTPEKREEEAVPSSTDAPEKPEPKEDDKKSDAI